MPTKMIKIDVHILLCLEYIYFKDIFTSFISLLLNFKSSFFLHICLFIRSMYITFY